MDKVIVTGGTKLQGTVRVSGAKNASLAILCATLLACGDIHLENIPKIADVEVLLEIMGSLGVRVGDLRNGEIRLRVPRNINQEASYPQVKKLRASNLLLGPLLSRFGEARVALPGGCKIGSRPMDLHFKGFAALGADVTIEHGQVIARAGELHGGEVYLDFPSVGATENIIMAATLAHGQTIIENAAKEPEVVDLANFLNTMGAKIRGAGTDVIKIDGVPELQTDGPYAVIPDRIEAGTFMVAAAATRGEVVLENIITRHLEPLVAKLREAGVEVAVDTDEERLLVRATGELKPIDVKTMPYPGFPTDMQSQFMAMLSTVPGTSLIIENVFENRYQVADEFKRMGADIKVEGRTAVIKGINKLQGASVKATDLRAGAALVIAGLMAEGETAIACPHYIDRGYENWEAKFAGLGATIKRIREVDEEEFLACAR